MKRDQRGFSIAELLVVMFIISLISGSAMVSYRGAQKQYYVSKAAQHLATDFRRAQNMALSGTTQGAVVPKGYGIYAQSSGQYILFYNTNSNYIYGGSSVSLETIVLDNSALSPVGATIYFSSPAPTTYINGANSGSQAFTITSGSSSRSITVDSGGRIEIN